MRLAKWWLILAIVAGLCVPLANAQDTSGKITGVVSDATDAIIPGAAVTARNIGTNATAKAIAGPNGAYTFESLVPGEYQVTCEQSGFSKYVGTGVRVSSQVATTLNIKLALGSTATEVRVTADATQVEVSTPSLQTTLGEQSLMSLPVQGRNLLETAQMLQPGSVNTGNGRGNAISFNGNRTNTTSYKVDGGDVTNYFNGMQQENTTFPQAENLAEFTVLTSTNEAKYGNTSGAQVIGVVKSGTNQLHGMGWGYLENQGWAANDWASNRAGVPRTPGSQKWMGFNAGGPVYLPKIYNGKDKTFFFFSYEYTNPSQFGARTFHVPTAAERAGDFSKSNFGIPNINGVPTAKVDPATFSPFAKKLLPDIPMGDDSQNGLFTWNYRQQLKTNAYVFKGDQLIGNKHRISGSVTRNFRDPQSNDFSVCCGGWENLPGWATIVNPHHITSLFFNHVFTINPSMVNTLSVGGSHTKVEVTRDTIKNVTWDSLGVSGVKVDKGALDSDINLFVQTWGGGFTAFNGYFDGRTSDTTNIQDDFIWMKGRHTFEMGYQQRYQAQTKVGSWNAAGSLSYFNWNAGTSGNPFADFLLDIGGEFGQNSGELVDRRYPSRSAYFQDRFKATRKLTLMVGLRWDPHEGITELDNKWSVYRPGQKSTVYPNAPAGLLYYGDPGIGKAGYDNKWLNFNPRLGFAYDVTGSGKLAIRGAYGIYSDFLTVQDMALDAVLPYSRGWSTGIKPGTYHIGMDPYFGTNAFPFTPPAPGSQEATNFQFPKDPQGIQTFDPNFNSARIHQYNASVQWEPLKSYVWTFAYVGNRGTHLFGKSDLNQPFYIPGQSTAANVQSRRPDQNFQSITLRNSDLNSRYNALQISLNKRYANGLALLANYTYGQSLGDGGDVPNEGIATGVRDPARRYLDYGPTGADIRHIFALSYNYDLPFFRQSPSRALKTALGGWVLGGTSHYRSGLPLTIGSPAVFNAGNAGAYANYVGGDIYGQTSNRNDQADHFLNKKAFCMANQTLENGACVTDPNAGVNSLVLGNTTKGYARSLGAFTNDMTLTKEFLLSERWGRLEFRAAAFNVFNHTTLGGPNTDTASGDFGKIFWAGPPRHIQLSLRYRF